jgi:hypothetical protein
MTLATHANTTCNTCRKPILNRRSTLQTKCAPCVYKAANARDKELRKAQRQAVVAERVSFRARKDALKSRQDWAREAQGAVNRYVRVLAHSRGEGCYTCGARPAQAFGGTYDAGHFRSVGSAPHLRFWTPQIRLQCVTCNRHKGGCALDFRRALVAEHGSEWVEALEARQEVAKFTPDYLRRIKRVFTKKANRLEKRNV